MALSNDQLKISVVLDAKGAEIGFKDLSGNFRNIKGELIALDKTFRVVEKDISDASKKIVNAVTKSAEKIVSEEKKATDAVEREKKRLTQIAERESKKASDVQIREAQKTAAALDKEITAGTQSFQQEIGKSAAVITSFGAALFLVQQALGYLQQAFSATIGPAVALESSVARIKTLLTDAEKATIDFSEAILTQQRAYGTNPETIGKALYEAIASGATDGAGAIVLLDTAQKLAIGGVTSLDTATKGLTATMSSYGIAATDAKDISDILFVAAAGGATDIESLATQLGDVTGLARAGGVSFKELAFAVSAVTSAGQPTAEAVTGVRSALSELLAPSKQLQLALEGIGITSVETAIKQDGLVGVLRKIGKEYGTNASALSALFNNVRALPTITALAATGTGNAFDKMNESFQSNVDNMVSATDRANDEIFGTIEKRAQVARGRIAATLTDIGASFVSTYEKILVSTADSFDRLAEIFSRLKAITAPVFNFLADRFAEVFDAYGKIADGIVGAIEKIIGATERLVGVQRKTSLKPFTLSEATGVSQAELSGTATPRVPRVAAETGELSKAASDKYIKSFDELETKAKDYKRLLGEIGKESIDLANEQQAAQLKAINATEEQAASLGLLKSGAIKFFQEARDAANTYFNAVKNNEAKKALEDLQRQVVALSQTFMLGSASEQASIDITLQGRLREIDALEKKQKALIAVNPAIKSQLDLTRQLAIAEADRARVSLEGMTPEQEQRLNAVPQDSYNILEQQYVATLNNAEAIDYATNKRLEGIDALVKELELQKSLTKDTLKRAEIERAIANAKGAKQDVVKGAEVQQAGAAQESVGKVIGSDLAGAIGQVFPDLFANLASTLGASLAQFANVFALVLKAPELINALAGFISQIAKFPTALADAIVNFVSSIGDFVGNFVSRIATAIPQIIDSLIKLFIDFLPQIPGVIIAGALQLVTSIIQKLPEIASALVQYFVLDGPKIAIGILKAIIVGVPKLIIGLVKAIPQFIPAIIKGIQEAFFSLTDEIAEMFSGGATKGLENAAASFESLGTGISNQLFAISDLAAQTAAGQKADEYAEQLRQGARDAFAIFERLWKWVKSIWSEYIFPFFDTFIIQPLKAAWEVIKIIFQYAADVFLAVWGVAKSIFDGIVSVFTALWDCVKILFNGIIDAFALAWEGVKSIFTALREAGKVIFDAPIRLFRALWEFAATVFDNPIKAFRDLWNSLKNIGTDLYNALAGVGKAIWGALKAQIDNAGGVFSSIGEKIGSALSGAVKGIFSALGNVFEKLDPSSAARKIGDAISEPIDRIWNTIKGGLNVFVDIINKLRLPKVDVGGRVLGRDFSFTLIPDIDLIPGDIARFAKGGIVGGQGTGDTVPALLTPGEFVMNRSAVQSIGASTLQSLNSGGGSVGSSNASNISVNLTLNAQERIDPAYVRDKLMPAIKDELRKESRRGTYILAAAGVRS